MSTLLIEASAGLQQRGIPLEKTHCGRHGWSGFHTSFRESYFVTREGELREYSRGQTNPLDVRLQRL